MAHFWIILTGCLVATCCSLLGSYLVLRKMAMVGDAISHAVLPGLVIAFLVAGSRSSYPMLIGAAAVGLLATVIIEYLSNRIRLQSDASIGLTFTFLFATGIILISLFAGRVDIDQDCVLYGEIAYVPLDRLLIGGMDIGPRAMWMSFSNLLLIVAFITFGYRGLFLTTFNSEYASTIGINIMIWQYALMGAVSVTTVFSFELVGAILVVAFLVVPPAAAFLLTTRLKQMLLLSVIFGITSAIGGFYLAKSIDGSVAGGMATASGMVFIAAFALSRLRRSRGAVSAASGTSLA
jgi:manganese/zinc/iron transport system permease protein